MGDSSDAAESDVVSRYCHVWCQSRVSTSMCCKMASSSVAVWDVSGCSSTLPLVARTTGTCSAFQSGKGMHLLLTSSRMVWTADAMSGPPW